jgi:acyl-CoA thioester hydrolase
MPADQWTETYRGTVPRWEVDDNDHFTVAYYMTRISDASVAMLHALGTGPAPTVDCFIRYQKELRVGDLIHVDSAVIAVDADGIVLGHKLFESAAGELCTTVEQRLAIALDATARRALEARRTAWDGPARDVRPRPRSLDGFRDSSRDTVKPWEIDLTGQLSLSATVHRFSGSNAHVLASFGVTPAYMRESRRGLSTFEFQLALRGEVQAGDPMVVRSALVHVGNSSVRFFHTMLDERSGTEVATLEQSGVHFDQERRRPAPLPDELRARAQALLVKPA